MADLKFKTRTGLQVDPMLTKPVNEPLRLTNQMKVTNLLAPYITKINACGAYILVTVEQDGQRFSNNIMDCEPKLFAEIMDKISGI